MPWGWIGKLSVNDKLMVSSKFVGTCLLVLLLHSPSAAAQSDPISEQCVEPSEDNHGGIDVGSFDDSPTQAARGQTKAQSAQAPAYQAPDKNNPKEVELDDVIFNETGGLRADPKAKPGAPGSAENLHAARVAVAEVAKRVLESSHPEREQAPRTLTGQTQRDLNAGNKDVIRSLTDSLSAARSGSNTTSGAMHFRTGRHKFRSLYGGKATMWFGPFHDATGGRHYFLTIAP